MGKNIKNSKSRNSRARPRSYNKKSSYSKRFSRYSNIKKAFLFASVFAIAAVAVLIIVHANASPYDDARQAKLVDNPQRGLVYKGLKAIKSSANHPCKGEFEIEGVKANGKPLCTHGPDPAPSGIEVTDSYAANRLNELDKIPKDKTTESELETLTPQQITAYADIHPFANHIPFHESAIPCTSGKWRIQPILITHAADTGSIISNFQSTILRMESQLEYSSLHSGPGSTNRHFRFVTDGSCRPLVKKVTTPDGYSLDSYSKAMSYLQDNGYKDSYTKYLVWVYAGKANFCGIGTSWGDDQPNATKNITNVNTGYAVVDTTCWGSGAEIHEIMHNLGAVENSAPHATGGGHCLDDHDEMCYPDYQDSSGNLVNCINASGLSYACGANRKPYYVADNCRDDSLEFLLDCNKNDYFNTGTVSPSNYLYSHWNVANSPYLQ